VVAKKFIFNWRYGQGTRNMLQEYEIQEGWRKSSTVIRKEKKLPFSRRLEGSKRTVSQEV
jgi:hypothetical protein